MDMVWQQLRYLLIAGGVALVFRVCQGCIGTPMIEQIVGVIFAGGAWAWGTYVKKGTVAVPAATGARPDVPTVSAATGQIQS